MTNQNFLNSNYTNNLQKKIQVFDQSQSVFFNTCFDKNQLKNLIAWFLEKYGEKITVDFLETLKQVGFHQATLAGVSLGVDDLEIPSQKSLLLSQALVQMRELTTANKIGNITSVEKSQRLIDTWNQTSEILRQTAVQNFRLTNPVNPVFMMAFSGARGNISQVRQLVAMRGLMADPQGAILEFPIQSNFREGLTITEYLISCYGARKGLVDTALRTATSGYLTRRLVDAVQHVVVVMTDCKTKRGILIKNKNLEQRLAGRVLLQDIFLDSKTVIEKNTLISQNLAKLLAIKHKEIYVRSPLTCNTEKSVCQLCYGLNLAQGKLVSIGEAVGVIAAQSIGEPGTQLTMRTFHTGGVGVFSDQAMKAFNAPFDGKVQLLENLPGLFVRTPHGHIVYLLKYSENDDKNKFLSKGTRPILRLNSLTSSQDIYEIMQNDVPPGSILWVKQGEYVKTGQLLVQASQIKTSKQQMPESSHPVQTPYSGEVFFESMVIRIVRKQTHLKSKKLIKKEEDLSPKFRTLTELGNFWVFSSLVQKEYAISKLFFVKGDLVSCDTPVFQYNLHIQDKGQLKRLKSSLIIGQNSFEFLLSKIYYYKFFYCLIKNDLENKKNLIVYNNDPKKVLLMWYPFFENLNNIYSGYCSIISNGGDLLTRKSSDLQNGTLHDLTIQKEYPQNQASFFWSEHQVFNFKYLDLLLESQVALRSGEKNKFFSKSRISYFLINHLSFTLSKKGIFQIQFHEKLNWSNSTRFPFKLLKNFDKSKSILVSKFLKKALKFSQISRFPKSEIKVIQKKQGWFYLPEKQLSEFVPSQLNSILLEPGKKFEKISFLNSVVSINFLQTENLLFLKSKPNRNAEKKSFFSSTGSFYSLENILNPTNCFLNLDVPEIKVQTKNKVSSNEKHCVSLEVSDLKSQILEESWNSFFSGEKKLIKTKTKLVIFTKKLSNQFCFYKTTLDFKFKLNHLSFKIQRKRQIMNVLFVQKNSQQFLPDIQFFKRNWFLQKTSDDKNLFLSKEQVFIKSPLFTKQRSTNFARKNITQFCFKILTPSFSDWFSDQNLIKIEIQIKNESCNSQKTIRKFKSNFRFSSINSSSLFTGFSFMFFNALNLQNANQFSFNTFYNGWVLPDFKVSQAFIQSKKIGEFGHLQINQNSACFSVLRNTDLITLKLPYDQVKTKCLKMGAIVRWGQEISGEFSIPISGQILKVTSKTFTIRRGIPILASARGVVHVFQNELVQKNDLLITLKSRRLQTEDIVQGIPKIEQLFEARETQGGEIITNSAHAKLQIFFRNALQSKPLRVAVNKSIHQIQIFLVESILEAYSNQGVKISEKHVEIVVRQMTARVRILSGGDSGLLPGEIVQLKWVERLNNRLTSLGSRQASYEPMILGITKSVLQSESFLVAASFQEVSRVLVRSALTKKTDFLRGLHENVILGQLIPAGTGIISRNRFDEKTLSSFEKEDKKPEVADNH